MAKDAAKYPLKLSLLGSFCVEIAHREIPMECWKSKKALVLFKYLAARCGEKIPNDMLVDLFWPDSDWDGASHNLHTTVYFLRKTLKEASLPDWDVSTQIRFANGLYWLELEDNDVLDTMEFAALCRESEDLEKTDPCQALDAGMKALKLYRGDFLAEELYADWAVSPREYYREQYMELSLRTSRLLVECVQDHKRAIRVCRAALNRDPYREELHQAVISYLIGSGRLPEAAAQYKACAKMLQDEFGLDPSDETRALLKQMQGDRRVSSITEELEKKPSAGAFVCDRNAFESILQLEKRRLERHNRPITLITIVLGERTALKQQSHKVLQVLERTLRKGDAACQWSDTQIAVLLPSTNEIGASVVVRRLKRDLDNANAGTFRLQYYMMSDSHCDVEVELDSTLSHSTN